MFGGESFATLVGEALRELTDAVWISFDIDGLDPALCPGTGTPVPGGLSFDQTMYLLDALRARSSQHDIVGFDLCEVGAGETDAIVGARVLYELCGTMTLAT
jgi:agmatinase